MKDGSSKTDNNASDHPLHDQGEPKGDKVQFRQHDSKGPAVPNEMPGQEGTKEERRAKAEALNKWGPFESPKSEQCRLGRLAKEGNSN